MNTATPRYTATFETDFYLDHFQTIILALIQGVTEFLPISSSAHLILPSALFGWPDQGLAFDTAVHLGTLLAVIWYFRLDLVSLIKAFFQHIFGRPSQESYFAINLLIASLPIIPAGFFLKSLIEGELRGTDAIIIATVVFSLLLFAADKRGKKVKTDTQLNWQDALIIGISQCFALVPGTSRSGVTITLGLFLGYTRESASRISFLLAIPAIAGASTLKSFDLVQASMPIDWQNLLLGITVSALCAYLCIRLFLNFINNIGFTPFVIYRLLQGAFLFYLTT